MHDATFFMDRKERLWNKQEGMQTKEIVRWSKKKRHYVAFFLPVFRLFSTIYR
jgi:hypothetical protein